MSNLLKIGFINVGSLGTNHDEFVAATEYHDVNIMAINETWLRMGEEGRAPLVPGYRLRHVPRPITVRGGRGGGVGFYVKRGTNVRSHAHPIDPQHCTVEQMWIVLSINGYKLAIGTAYRPPWQDIDLFLDALTSSCNSLYFCRYTILLGDFNINYLNQSDSRTHKLNIFLSCLNMQQKIMSTTHFTTTSQTLIDLVCTNANVSNIIVDTTYELGGHAIICCSFPFRRERVPLKTITARSVNNIPLEQLSAELDSVDWHLSFKFQDINDMVAFLNTNLIAIFDKYAPQRTRIIKERSYPWITTNIKLMMHLRNQARLKYLQSNVESKKIYYKELKKLVNTSLHLEKVAYYKYNINNKIKNPRTLWKNLKNTLLPPKSDLNLPPHLNDPNLINSHFLDVPGNTIIPLSCLTYYEYNRLNDTTFSLKPVDQIKILRILSNLKSNAQGCDGITLDMIRLSLPQTADILTHIINYSIKMSVFPDLWKVAIVRPLPKKNNPVDVKDLRPISILPFLSKVLEKVVNTQLSEYLERSNILPEVQSGFRKSRSTATALLDVTDNILVAQDEGLCTLLVLLDFSRAFDAINLSLLLSKMAYYGFEQNTIKWFDSYLTHRAQYVEIINDGSRLSSDMRPVVKGVPQGSILGPLLFSLYSADIVSVIKNCRYHLYADDLQIYFSFQPHELETAVRCVNEDLVRIAKWSNSNSLIPNPSKTKYLIFGTTYQLQKLKPCTYNVNMMGVQIERVTEARNLGLIMDQGLRFEKHVVNCVQNCFYRLKILYNLRPYLSEELRIQLVESIVLSKLTYADTVFGPRLLARTDKILQRIQNACTRFCFNIPPRAHVTPFLNKHSILKMKSRRKLHLASLLFGVIKYKCPPYLYSKITWVSSHRQREGRRCAQQLATYKHKTAAFRGSFRYAASKCWNNIPPPIRDLKNKNLNIFKKKLKTFLLSSQLKHQETNANLSFI